MTDLHPTIHAHHDALTDFLDAARSVEPTKWDSPPAPGEWSPGQVVEHAALSYKVNLGVLHGRAQGAAAPRFLRPIFRVFLLNPVLRNGTYPLLTKSPPVLQPSETPTSPAVLIERLQAAAMTFERDAATISADTIDHPFFSRLCLVEFVRFQEIHTRHHCQQLAHGAV